MQCAKALYQVGKCAGIDTKAPLAQSVERGNLNLNVGGSIPPLGIIFFFSVYFSALSKLI